MSNYIGEICTGGTHKHTHNTEIENLAIKEENILRQLMGRAGSSCFKLQKPTTLAKKQNSQLEK